MSLWKIAWRSIQHRALASTLTALSMALGVALVVAVLVMYSVVDRAFNRCAQGYDLVVGSKGGRLELVLNTIYHIGQSLKPLPYHYYEQFLPGGDFAASVEVAIPVCMGDSVDEFRVIGTVPEMFTKLTYLDEQRFAFLPGGRNFDEDKPFEAVVGYQVAKKMHWEVGKTFKPTHGVAEKGAAEHGHQHKEEFTVVGVLAPTTTPVDRGVYVNMEGFFHLEGHVEDIKGSGVFVHPENSGLARAGDQTRNDQKKTPDPFMHDDHDEPIPDSAKRVSAILVRCRHMEGIRSLTNQIDKGEIAQAASPVEEIRALFDQIVGQVQKLLLLLAVLVVVVAGIGILVSIYNSMNDRRREIAIMRALGARRWIVMAVILLESILLSLGGGALGLLLGHGLIALLSPTIQQYGIVIGTFQFEWIELVLIPGLIGLAAAVGYIPAALAYRTDVARSLTGTP